MISRAHRASLSPLACVAGFLVTVAALPCAAQETRSVHEEILQSARQSLTSSPAASRGARLVTKARGSKTVKVNCNRGQTINGALASNAAELTIEISGICNEDVLIRRDNVTLRGTDPATDGVQGVTPTADDLFSAAVTIREARNIHIENLGLTGGADGLRVENARRNITADNLVLSGGRFGVVAVGGGLALENSTLINSGTAGAATAESGRLTCNNCTVADNPSTSSGFGAFAITSSALAFNDSTIAGSRFPVFVDSGAFLTLTRTVATGGGDFGPLASSYATLNIVESTFDGSMFISEKSTLNMTGSTQLTNPFGNSISQDSQVNIGNRQLSDGTIVESTLPGDTFLNLFSHGRISASTTLGNLSCFDGADLVCAPTVIKASSTCGLCP